MLRVLTSFLWAAGAAQAVIVTPGSPCANDCGNVLDSTAEDEMVCLQDDYETGKDGELFQTCLECELHSDYSNDGMSDTQMMLYNMRFAANTCLFDASSNQCITSEACGPYRNAITFGNLATDIETYDYCAAWPITDQTHLDQCKDCLLAMSQDYLANFFTVLQGACEQRPDFGFTVSVDGDLFSRVEVNVTDPTPKASIDPDWFYDGPLDLNARAGIAAGGFVFILIIIGFLIIWRGRRRRRAFLRDYDTKIKRKHWPAPLQTQGMQEATSTPLSQRPLRAWDESPVGSEQAFPRYFSPYSSQYSSPVSGTDAHLQGQLQHQWPSPAGGSQQHLAAPGGPPRNIGLAFAGDSPVHESGDIKGKQPAEEAYEMHHVKGGYGHGEKTASYFPAGTLAEQQQHQQEQEQVGNGQGRRYSGSYRNFSSGRGS